MNYPPASRFVNHFFSVIFYISILFFFPLQAWRQDRILAVTWVRRSAAVRLRGPGSTTGLIMALELKEFTEACQLNWKWGFFSVSRKREVGPKSTWLLCSLHRIPAEFRVQFNVLMFIFKDVNVLALTYLSEWDKRFPVQEPLDVDGQNLLWGAKGHWWRLIRDSQSETKERRFI